MSRLRSSLATTVGLAIMAVLVLPAGTAAQSAPTSPTVTTEGRATIKVAPDMAWVTVTAASRAAGPADAQSANAQAIAKVRASLRAAGVKDEAVKTRSYNVEPQMQYANGTSTVIGYIAQQSLEVKVDALANLGKVIDAAGADATSIGDIRYDTSRRADLEAEALAASVKDGIRRAEQIAAAAGRAVLSVWHITDQHEAQIGPRPMALMAAAPRAAETTITPAEVEIQASVTVTVILK